MVFQDCTTIYVCVDKVDLSFSHLVPASYHSGQLDKNLFVAFEIQFNKMMCSLRIKLLSIQQFIKNFHYGVQNSV